MPIGQGVSRIGILKTRFQSDNPVNLLRLKAIAMSLFRSPSLPIQINNLRNLRDLREIINLRVLREIIYLRDQRT